MNRLFKRILSGALAASMVIGTLVLPAAAEVTDDDLLVNITFDEDGTSGSSFTATKGGTVTKSGTVTFADSFDAEQGKAMYISSKSGSNYLALPDGLLQGKQAATFSFWVKATSDTNPNWPFMYTAEESHAVGTEKYLGMLVNTGGMTAERYNNTTTRLSSVSASSTSDWQYITAVFESAGTRIYQNGKLVASDTVTVNVPALFTASSHTWIGHANWDNGEGFQGYIDDFKIYGKALSADEVKTDAAKAIQIETQKAIEEKNCLEISTDFFEGANKVFQMKSSDVTIKTTVTNSTISAKTLKFDVTPYDSTDQPLTEAAVVNPDHTKTLVVLDTVEFSETVSPSTEAAYYKVTVTDITNSEKPVVYASGYLAKANVSFPDASPSDSASTTEGAHDPTIFKDPVSGKFYAYSSHNLVFESTDLINWTKHDYTSRASQLKEYTDDDLITPSTTNNTGIVISVPPKAKAFIDANYTNTKANVTYWAPDILYKADDEYPYWFYLSTSCGLGGRNSVISLVKAKSPGLWDGEYSDEGVVIASKENSNYSTNAIDANIFTDTDGKVYIVWGSFWKGIHGIELDSATGRAKGVNYDTDATILSSCQNFGNRLYSTPAGVAGPEGPWMTYNSDTGYRYMVTSYGWLGTNYNIRIARTNKTMSAVFAENPHRQFLDQKNRPVGTTYADQVKEGGNLGELWGYKMLGSYQLGDGITYLGNGHCSVIENEGEWYLVEHCRKVADAVAYLQVRKILWNENGWPVVSPLVYAGEDEQVIPKEMLYGTWDLSSVGHTILEDGVTDVSKSGAYKGSDLPVLSSEVIVEENGKIANSEGVEIGTWEYDDDHTVTFKFTQSGSNENYEFYADGDEMKLYVLTGYDKDKRESALVIMGTDQNDIAQFGKKNNEVTQPTKLINHVDTTPIVIDKSEGGNPIVGMESTAPTYGGDPSVLVDGDTVYLYAGHDTATTEDYVIPEYICYSSQDLKNWTPHGSVFKVSRSTVPWASGDTSAWAGQVLKYKDKYYLFYCTWGNSTYSGYQCIGVATSTSPTGPFTNVSTTPLINGKTMTTENSSAWNDIDPTVWLETVNGEEHIYLNWGNGHNYTCELTINGDTVSVKGNIVHTTFKNLEGSYTEAPYLYRRVGSDGNYTGKYYLFFAKDWREQWAYATTDDIMSGSWDYGNLMMQTPATSNTSHGAVFDFKGKTYFIYHNGSLPGGSGFRRVANIQEVTFNEDGSVSEMPELSTGINGTSVLMQNGDNFVSHEHFTNPLSDDSYPLKKQVGMEKAPEVRLDAEWEIVSGKTNADDEHYVSIRSVNKSGLYLTASGKDIILSQLYQNTEALAKTMTFKTVEGINGIPNTVSFESASKPGYFITVSGNALKLTDGVDVDACSFNIVENDITNLEYKDAALSFDLNSAEVGDNVTAYIAEYNKDGVLTDMTVKKDVTVTSLSSSISIPYTPKSAESTLIKLFVWKNLKPLSACKDLTDIVIPKN